MLGTQAQALGERPAAGQAFVVVRIAQLAAAFRQAMKTHQQAVVVTEGADLLPVPAYARREGIEIGGVAVVVAHEAHFRLIARALQPACGDIHHGGGRAGCVLRVERQDQDALMSCGFQFVEHGG